MTVRFLSATLLLGALGLMSDSARADVGVGDSVPDFELVGSDGKTYTNEQFKNKQAIVIAWYPKAFTGGWTKECQSLRESGKAIRQFNVAYFTASVDSVETNTDFAKSLDLDYPILSDPDKSFSKELGCLNARGMANRWTYYIGKDGKVLHVDKAVKAASHGEAIAAKLADLGVEKKSPD